MISLHQIAETVSDESSFIAFVRALADDFMLEQQLEGSEPLSPYGPGKMGWENNTVAAFLNAAVAWALDSRMPASAEIEQNPWQRCAQMLLAGKSYE